MKKLALGVLLGAAAISIPTAAVGEAAQAGANQRAASEQAMAALNADEIEIRRLQQEWMDAWVRQDYVAIDRILAPDYTLTVSSAPAQPVTRDKWIELVERFTAQSFEYRDIAVRLLGDVAVVSSIGRAIDGRVDGADRSFPFFLTDVWVKRQGQWKVTARYSSIPEINTESSKAFK